MIFFNRFIINIAAATIMIWSVNASAEESAFIESGQQMGFVAGANMGTLQLSRDADSRLADSTFGWGPGLTLGLRGVGAVHPYISLQAEVLYIQRRVLAQTPEEFARTLHLIQGPLFMRFNFPFTERIAGNLHIGVTGSVPPRNPFASFESTTPQEGELRPNIFGTAIGVGLDIAFPRRSISVDMRYDWGPGSVIDFPMSSALGFHSSIRLMVGYQFSLPAIY